MKPNFDKLTKKLTDLDKKAEELDKVLQDVRIAINNVFWDLMELKRFKTKENKTTSDNSI